MRVQKKKDKESKRRVENSEVPDASVKCRALEPLCARPMITHRIDNNAHIISYRVSSGVFRPEE